MKHRNLICTILIALAVMLGTLILVSCGEAAETPEVTAAPDTAATEPGEPGEDPVETEAPETTTAAEVKAFEPEYKALYLKGDNRHRYYEIQAKVAENADLIDFYVRIPAQDNSTLKKAVDEQIRKINKFATSNKDVHWYVFPVTCFEDTALCDEILPTESKR